MLFQVPQFLDIEDKIIGPLTLKQFIILLVGGGMLFLLYNMLKFPIFIIFAVPIALFFLALAFYKIGNQKFTQFVINILGFISKPNIYIWKKIHPKQTSQEPLPKIIKKVESPKQAPQKNELEEMQWRVEIK